MRGAMTVCVAAGICLCGCAAPAGRADAPGGTASAAAPAGASGEVLARVGGTVITDRDLDEKIASMPARVAGRFRTPVGKRNLLSTMVELEIISREAAAKGLDRDQETLARIEDARKRIVAERLREQVFESVEVDRDESLKEYEKDADRYKTQKQVRVSQILFTWDAAAPPKTIDAVKQDAAKILERARKGEEFAELARNYSLDRASASKGGDIGYATRRSLTSEAYAAAMAMEKEGELSGLIEGKDELRILKATEIVPERKKPFEEMSAWLERTVRSRKQREAWSAYLAELKNREGVEIYEEKLGAAEGTAESGPPALRRPRRPRPEEGPQGAVKINLGGPSSSTGASGWVQPDKGKEQAPPASAPSSGAM